MLRFYVGIAMVMPAPTPTRPEEREFVVKEQSSEEMGTVKRSRNPTVVLTANGEVRNHEEAQVFVHQNLRDRTRQETLQQERREAWELATSVYEKKMRIKLRFTLLPQQGQCLHPLRKARGARIRSSF